MASSTSPSISPSYSPSYSPSISPSVSPSPADLIYPPTQNGLQKTLGAELAEAEVTTATFNNTTGIQNKKGLFVVDRIDASGNEKDSSLREYVSFEAVSGSTVTTLTRGLAGTTDQVHATGAIVEFISDVVQQQALIDTLLVEHGTDGTHKQSLVATLTGTQTLINKTITSVGDFTQADDKDIKFSSGAKIERSDGHLVLTPETSKLIKTAVLRQDLTTDTYTNNAVILCGWSFVQSEADGRVTKAISFGVTFASAPIVNVTYLTTKNSSDPTAIGDFTGGQGAGEGTTVCAYSITTTGFTVDITQAVGTIANTFRFGFSWMAIGVLS